MKKYFLSTMLLVCFLSASSQDIKTHKNEFGLDFTGFARQFLFNNNDEFSSNYYDPIYFVTYRRHIKKSNLRFGIGGSYEDKHYPSSNPNDSLRYHSVNNSVDLRLGYEFTSEIAKRWQVFYGVDLRSSISHYKNDAPFNNAGYANGSEGRNNTYGVAPVLGVRFRITDRLSLLTEANFAFNIQKETSSKYFIPLSDQYPPLPDVGPETTNRTFTSFTKPLALYLTFDL